MKNKFYSLTCNVDLFECSQCQIILQFSALEMCQLSEGTSATHGYAFWMVSTSKHEPEETRPTHLPHWERQHAVLPSVSHSHKSLLQRCISEFYYHNPDLSRLILSPLVSMDKGHPFVFPLTQSLFLSTMCMHTCTIEWENDVLCLYLSSAWNTISFKQICILSFCL